MSEATNVEAKAEVQPKPQGFVRHRSLEERIKQEEAELAELMKGQTAPAEEASEEAEEQVSEAPAEQEEVEQTAEPVSAEEKTFKKRYGDLRRHAQKQKEELEKRIADMEKQLAQATKKQIEYPSSEDELTAWMEKYPDVAKVVETIALKKADERTKDFEDRFAEIEELKFNARREKAEVELLKLHPDLNEINDSDEFHEWVESQPDWVQKALYDNGEDARSAARAIDLYKADMGISKKKATSGKDAAKSVNTRTTRSAPTDGGTGKTFSESQVNKMSAQEYEKNQEAIAEAIRTGKFLYDISGSAR